MDAIIQILETLIGLLLQLFELFVGFIIGALTLLLDFARTVVDQSPSCMQLSKAEIKVLAFSALYLLVGGLYFLQDLNLEFVIYVLVIVGAFALLFGTLRITQLPTYILWLISIWGLLHILGGSVPTPDGVLFAYKIYPFMDFGGDFYILKYDQLVHAYLYGTMALVFLHVLKQTFKATGKEWMLVLVAVMASMGVSSLNEIMEFLIAVTLERNGVGGYENAMLDLIFNLSGAVLAICILYIYRGVVKK